MKRIEIPEKELKTLYIHKELSSSEIAEIYDCSKRTILKRLRKYDIPRRSAGPKRRNDITEEKLRELYIKEGLSTRDIAEKLDSGRSTISRKLKEFEISTRDISESHIKYDRKDFSGNTKDKYYLLGFSIGDLRVRKIGDKSRTIKVDCGSTKEEQVELIEDIFSSYGKVWRGGPYEDGSVHVEAFLNESFAFLLDARDELEELPKKENSFWAFLAGFIDAEGSFFVTNDTAKFSLGNYDKELLEMIKNRLEELGIQVAGIYENEKKYEIEGKYTRNENYCLLQLNRMNDLLKLVESIEPYIEHEGRRSQMETVRTNIQNRKGD